VALAGVAAPPGVDAVPAIPQSSETTTPHCLLHLDLHAERGTPAARIGFAGPGTDEYLAVVRSTPVWRVHELAPHVKVQPKEDEMAKVFPCLWFDGNAEEAASFYVTLLPDSQVDNVWRSPAETPSGPAGMVLTVDFTLAGQQFQGLNGGPDFRFNESVSFVIDCDDQAEVDRLWQALTAGGGEPGPCGWLKDRFGLSWQIVPRRLGELVNDPDFERARRAMEAMLKMGKIEIAELERAADAA
jgi:predicted 3-demethylubiquinone-9 3-methyltransferase (glyoxalase superfamily)